MSKQIGLSFAALALICAPFIVSAQTATNGILTVHVQVINQQGTAYSPSNFAISVTGQSPSPATFQGSQSGTIVSLNPGSFSVAVTGNLYGFTPTYSTGCTNTIAAGGTHSCVITLSGYNTQPYYPYNPYPYPYNYTTPALTCTPAYQTLRAGQTATFTAQGGVGGTYNWFTNGRTYSNVGPTFTSVIENTGSQLVTVTNGAQTATCSVTVNSVGGYYPNYPVYTPTYSAPTVYQTYSAYPYLPNTGLEPQSAAALAFAAVLLLGAAVVSAPYVRKALAIVVR